MDDYYKTYLGTTEDGMELKLVVGQLDDNVVLQTRAEGSPMWSEPVALERAPLEVPC